MAEQKTLSLKDFCALAICEYVLNADADTLADAFVSVVPHDGKICTTSIDGRWKSNSTLRSVLPLALFVSCAFQLSQT